MEDEGFVDDEFIEDTARDFVARHGWGCLALLRERARIAAASGDFVLAETWRRIIETAEEMLGAGFVGDTE